MIDKVTLEFAWQHRFDDAARLILQHHTNLNLRTVAQQIEGLQAACDKWPSLAGKSDYIFPPRLNREQSSSEAAAQYKASLAGEIQTAADLTGGMGIDTMALASQVKSMHYCELNEELCSNMNHNCEALGYSNIKVHNTDGIAWLTKQDEPIDLVYIDPARRDTKGHKVTAFEDCQPNILDHLTELHRHARKIMIKASPMVDISAAVKQLGGAAEIHIVAVKGECKELLFILGECETLFSTTNIRNSSTDIHTFTAIEEKNAKRRYATFIRHYLYEPNSAIMKAGCYNLICSWFDIEKLSPATHLYTSDTFIENFPGRIFEIRQEISPTKKALKSLLLNAEAHVICRNYPVRADILQKQLGLKEGGSGYLIATTINGNKKAFLAHLLKSAIQ